MSNLKPLGKPSLPFTVDQAAMKANSDALSNKNKTKAILKRKRLLTFVKLSLVSAAVGAAVISYFIVKDDIALVKEVFDNNVKNAKQNVRIGLNNYQLPSECEATQHKLYKCQMESKKRPDQCLSQHIQLSNCVTRHSSLSADFKPFKSLTKDILQTPEIISLAKFDHSMDQYNTSWDAVVREKYTKAPTSRAEMMKKLNVTEAQVQKM